MSDAREKMSLEKRIADARAYLLEERKTLTANTEALVLDKKALAENRKALAAARMNLDVCKNRLVQVERELKAAAQQAKQGESSPSVA
jgi:predicted  nucleic acid-binding Zn-ribbon protein